MKEPLGFEIGGKARSIEALINQAQEGGVGEGPKIINIGKVGV